MDKKFFSDLSERHGVSSEVAKQIYLEICKEMATRLAANEKQSNPFFSIKPVARSEKKKTLPDGSEKTIESRLFGRMTLKGVTDGSLSSEA